MRTIIIDDERLAREELKKLLKDYHEIEIIDEAKNPEEGIEKIKALKPDLIFLDIQMPKITGIDFLKSLQTPPMVILTTAYPNYALQGFELDVVDYLVKPIPFHRFLKSVVRAQQVLNPTTTVQAISEHTTAPELEQDFMFVRAEYENVKMNFSDILFIEGLKDYVKIYTIDNKFTLTLISLIKLENLLSNKGFSRIHRSYIINIKHVKSIQKNKVLISDKRIPISESYKTSFFERINL